VPPTSEQELQELHELQEWQDAEESLLVVREIRKTTHGWQTHKKTDRLLHSLAPEEYACYLYLKWDLPGVLSLLLAALLI